MNSDDVNLEGNLNDNNFENLLLSTEGLEPLSSRRSNPRQSPSAKNMKKIDLSCFVCLKQFDGEQRVPRRMPNCEHSFCHKCVQDAINMSPTCQRNGSQHILLTPQGALQCPIDHSIIAP